MDSWAKALPGDVLISKGQVVSPGWSYDSVLDVSWKTVMHGETKPSVDCVIVKRPSEVTER